MTPEEIIADAKSGLRAAGFREVGGKPKTVKISAELWELMRENADYTLSTCGREKQWADENQTSTRSNLKGGFLKYETDRDWVVAFMIWWSAREDIVARLPRES
jgi:hypothetical protein